MKKKNPERMRYKNDTFSAGLVFLSIGFNVAYFVTLYSNSSVIPSVLTGVDVVTNILFIMIAFWASEMVKVYNKKWSYCLVAMGAIQFVRMTWLPAHYNALGQLIGTPHAIAVWSLALSGALMLIAAFNSYRNSAILGNYMRSLEPANRGEK